MDDVPDGPGDLRTPFIFVPLGDPEPVEWMADHPGWVKFPAVMVPRTQAGPDQHGSPADRSGYDRAPGTMWAFSRRPDPPPMWRLDPYDPMSPAFDAVATLHKIGYFAADPAGVVQAQWWMPLLEGPLLNPPEGILPRLMERIPGQSGKEAADDTPSWARGIKRQLVRRRTRTRGE